MDAMRFRLLGRNVLLGEVPWSPLKAWQPRENGQASKQASSEAGTRAEAATSGTITQLPRPSETGNEKGHR